MRMNEITNTQEQLELWRLISDTIWSVFDQKESEPAPATDDIKTSTINTDLTRSFKPPAPKIQAPVSVTPVPRPSVVQPTIKPADKTPNIKFTNKPINKSKPINNKAIKPIAAKLPKSIQSNTSKNLLNEPNNQSITTNLSAKEKQKLGSDIRNLIK